MLVLFEPCRLLPFYVALAVAFSTIAFGAEILSQVNHDLSYWCQEQKHIVTTKYNVSGIELTRRSFTCIDDMPILKRQLSTRAELQQNNAVECHTDESCQCGIQSSCSCSSEPDFAPSVNDCSALVDALQVVTQVAGPTFVTESGGFELISFQTCAVQFNNFQTVASEYCWDELGRAVGSASQACFNEGGGPSAACSGLNGLWDITIERFSP